MLQILIVIVVFYRNFLLVSGTVWAHLPITLTTAMKLESKTDDKLVSVDSSWQYILGFHKKTG
jgi:hypothetical protein